MERCHVVRARTARVARPNLVEAVATRRPWPATGGPWMPRLIRKGDDQAIIRPRFPQARMRLVEGNRAERGTRNGSGLNRTKC